MFAGLLVPNSPSGVDSLLRDEDTAPHAVSRELTLCLIVLVVCADVRQERVARVSLVHV